MHKALSLKLNCSHRPGLLKGASTMLAIGILMTGAQLSLGAHTGKAGEKTHKVIREVTNPIEPRVVYQLTRELAPGRVKKVQEGEAGSITQTVEFTKLLSHVVGKRVLNEVRHDPKDTIILMGRGGFEPSRHSFYRRDVRTMIASAYDPGPRCNGRRGVGRTCTGRTAKYGVIAVDPRVIPFGTLMYIEGYGFGIAADRGSAIKGNRIDLCYGSRRVANNFGMQKVRVHILGLR